MLYLISIKLSFLKNSWCTKDRKYMEQVSSDDLGLGCLDRDRKFRRMSFHRGKISLRKFRRKEISPQGNFAVRNFRRKEIWPRGISPYGFLFSRKFRRIKKIYRMEIKPYKFSNRYFSAFTLNHYAHIVQTKCTVLTVRFKFFEFIFASLNLCFIGFRVSVIDTDSIGPSPSIFAVFVFPSQLILSVFINIA